MTALRPNSLSEVRKHYYLDQYVVIAPKRTHSLHHEEFTKTGVMRSPPLESESSVFEIPKPDGGWAVKVVSNLFPAFTTTNKQAYGVQEVVLEADDPPDIPFGQFSIDQIERVFVAFRQRLNALRRLKNINYVSVFHNQGLEAGASVKQTHSQIIATQLAPPKLAHQAKIFSQLRKQYGISPLSRAMAWEEQQQARLVHTDSSLTIVCPYASVAPFEVWLVTKRHVRSLCELKRPELRLLAKALKAVILPLESEQISYNFHLIETIRNADNHFYIQVVPRPNVWAGFELNTGIAINPVAPEEAARWYNGFIKQHNAL